MLEPQSVIAWIIIGAIAGWLAGLLVKGFGFGLIGNIVVGILGAGLAGIWRPVSVSIRSLLGATSSRPYSGHSFFSSSLGSSAVRE